MWATVGAEKVVWLITEITFLVPDVDIDFTNCVTTAFHKQKADIKITEFLSDNAQPQKVRA